MKHSVIETLFFTKSCKRLQFAVEDSPIRISFHYWEGILWLKPSSWHHDVFILGKCTLRSVKCEIYMYCIFPVKW